MPTGKKIEDWKEQLKEDWGIDDAAGVYYKGYSLGHQMDDLESYISKLLTTQKDSFIKIVESKKVNITTKKVLSFEEMSGYNQALDDLKDELESESL